MLEEISLLLLRFKWSWSIKWQHRLRTSLEILCSRFEFLCKTVFECRNTPNSRKLFSKLCEILKISEITICMKSWQDFSFGKSLSTPFPLQLHSSRSVDENYFELLLSLAAPVLKWLWTLILRWLHKFISLSSKTWETERPENTFQALWWIFCFHKFDDLNIFDQ